MEDAPPFTDAPNENENLVPNGLRGVMFTFVTLVIVVCVYAIGWVARRYRKPVMAASQPAFMALIAIGCIIGTSSSYFLGWDETYVSEEELTVFCNATWWLLSIGLTFVTSGLNLKLYRIVKLFKGVQRLRQTVVALNILVIFMCILLAINIGILSLWATIDPLGTPQEFEKIANIPPSLYKEIAPKR